MKENRAIFLLWIGLGIVTLIRLVIASLIPLSPDEAYYWIWSKALAVSYFDHPPMVAGWIKIGCLLFGDHSLGIRFLAPISAFIGSGFLFFAACDFVNGDKATRYKAACWAVCLLNATLAVGAGAVIMTPDTPLLFFTTMLLWACGRLLATQSNKWWWWIGIAIGLGLLSKYTALLPVLGIIFWCFCTRYGRRFLKCKELWGSAILALLLFSPVIWWNAQNHWVSFFKQGGRTGSWEPQKAVRYLLELIGGQIGMATPLIFLLFVVGIVLVSRDAVKKKWPGDLFLSFVIIVPLLVFVQHAFGDRVQANWVVLLYPALALSAASKVHRGLKWATALGVVIVIPIYIQAIAHPFPLPSKLDITLKRLGGWQNFAIHVQHYELNKSYGSYLFADEYGLAAELAYYLPEAKIGAIDPRWKFFNLPHGIQGSVLLIRSTHRKEPPSSDWFSQVEKIDVINREQGGKIAETYIIYRAYLRNDAKVQQMTVRLPTSKKPMK